MTSTANVGGVDAVVVCVAALRRPTTPRDRSTPLTRRSRAPHFVGLPVKDKKLRLMVRIAQICAQIEDELARIDVTDASQTATYNELESSRADLAQQLTAARLAGGACVCSFVCLSMCAIVVSQSDCARMCVPFNASHMSRCAAMQTRFVVSFPTIRRWIWYSK